MEERVKEEWYGGSLEATPSDPLVDAGTGEKRVLRTFEYSLNPDLPKNLKISKQELFNAHARQIREFLWMDGLVPADEVPPKVLLSKRKKLYAICVVAKARLGVMWNDKTRTLQDVLNK